MEIARAAAPFEPPPDASLSDDGYAHLLWPFPRDAKQGGATHARLDLVELPLPQAVPALLNQGRWEAALARLEKTSAAQDGEAGELARLVGATVLRLALAGDDTRRVAVDAVGFGRVVALAPELRAIAGEDPGIRPAAVRALGRLGDASLKAEMLKMLPRLDAQAVAAAEALGRSAARAEAWAALKASVQGRRGLDAMAVAEALAARESVETLVGVLESGGKAKLRAAAARALGAAARGEAGDATEALRKALTDDSAEVRLAAAEGIARAGREGAISKGLFYRLIPLVNDDPDSRVRGAAMVGVGATGRDRASADLVLLSKKVSGALRARAAEALALVPTPEALERLVALAGSDDVAVRRAAVFGLAGRHEEAAWKAAAEADLTGAKLEDEDRMGLASLRFMAAGATVPAFARAVREAKDANERSRVIGAWLDARRKR